MRKSITIIIILFITYNCNAQLFTKKKLLNNENFDKPTLSWGYFLGLNNYDYNFDYNNNLSDISGKSLFIITLVILSILSILISNYIFINLKIILNLLMSNNEYLVQYDIDKQILFVVIISIFLIFKKTKFFLKKITLTNFLIFSIINWYSQINHSSLNDVIPFYIFKFENINFVNIVFLLAIETMFYLWSYISYNSYLSDWNVPKPYKNEVTPIFNIIMFYLLVILYYSILFK